MHLTLLAVGRMKAGPERELCARYGERAQGLARSCGFAGFEVREIEESRARRPEDRKAEEARGLLALCAAGAVVFALDERGASVSSGAFAARLRREAETGARALALLIGGADGLDPSLRDKASLTIAFGAMTWPHQLARSMAAEQIYRAMTILANHPYHRA